MSLDHLGSYLPCATNNFLPVCAMCTHRQCSRPDGLCDVVVRVERFGLEPTASESELVREGMEFIQRIGNQMAPFTAAPLDSFCINIDSHEARLGTKNVQVFCT